MNLDYQSYIPQGFDPNSKVWIYQSNRLLTNTEASDIQVILQHFIHNWKSHGKEVKGFAHVFFNMFIVFMADEKQTGVSGCSTDSSVQTVKKIVELFNIDFFDRQLLTFIQDNRLIQIPLQQLTSEIANNHLSAEQLYFNNTILTKKELEEKWIIPLKYSWLNKFIPNNN